MLLQALWERPGATVQEVHDWLAGQEKRVVYTTVLTQLQRMYRKGLVRRERSGKQHCYYAVPEREEVERQLVDRLRQSVFGGSKLRLALRALGEGERPDAGELDELQRWLDAQKPGNDE
jgi:predicted transcriptional regulator